MKASIAAVHEFVLGTKRTWPTALAMSARRSKVDIAAAPAEVRK
jgi:hypothetical protein